jgi:predicted RNA-binding Zn-ribbon protein involved in translation (DUF1610 family)
VGGVLLNAAAVLSAVVWVATVVLWVRGFWLDENLFVNSYNADGLRQISFWSYRNGFSVGVLEWDGQDVRLSARDPAVRWESQPGGLPGWERGFGLSPGELRWSFARFAWIRMGRAPRRPWMFFVFPAWFAGVTFAVVPAVAVRRWRRERRGNAPGLCPSCGYDLRATPERCPECGTVVAAATSPACIRGRG